MSWIADAIAWLHAPWTKYSDIERDLITIKAGVLEQTTQNDTILKEIRAMGVREDQAYEKLTADIQTVKDGWASLTAERDQYKAALETADADKAAAVQAALDADSDVDAGKVEAADAALAELVAPAPAPEPEPTPEPAPVVDEPVTDQPA